MRQTLGAIIAVSLLASGCTRSLQSTRMYNGQFGRTEVGAVMIAADPSVSKVLVQTYDGDLWIHEVDSSVQGRLSTLRVGDEVILAFDDRIAGKRAIAVNVVAPGRRPVPPGSLSVAAMLPVGVVFGSPALSPATASGVDMGGTMVAANGGGFVAAGGGSAFVNGTPGFAGPGVIPGFGSFSTLPAGMLTPQTAFGLGIVPGTFQTAASPFGGPSVAGTGGVLPGRTPFTQGNFTPGTIAPGVTTANPNASGAPVSQGPFTPGTVAPGVSQQRGNAPPPAAGATTGATPRQTMTRGTPASTAAPPAPGSGAQGPAATSQGGAAPSQGGTVTPQGTRPQPQGTAGQPQGTAAQPQGTAGQPQGGAQPQPTTAAPQGQPAGPAGGAQPQPMPVAPAPQGGAPRSN